MSLIGQVLLGVVLIFVVYYIFKNDKSVKRILIYVALIAMIMFILIYLI